MKFSTGIGAEIKECLNRCMVAECVERVMCRNKEWLKRKLCTEHYHEICQTARVQSRKSINDLHQRR